jgi:mRNA-degrading endonuclease YafQ of YafQ-DinJ toxin-antitoxin module
MINIEITKKFKKQVALLTKKHKQNLFDTLQIFRVNPYDQLLKTHPLKGNLAGLYSFSVTGDIRIHFLWKNNKKTAVLLLQIGTHSQLY